MPNIVNIHSIDDVVTTMALRAGHEEVRTWCLRNFRKYLLRESQFCIECRDSFTFKRYHRLHEMEDMPGWASRLLNEGKSFHIFDPTCEDEFFSMIEMAIDYLNHFIWTYPRHRLDRFSVIDTLGASAIWHARFTKQQEENTPEDPNGITEVMTFEQGMRIVRLHSPASLAREGALMGHCVGGYVSSVARNKVEIYSVRDQDNCPHVTIEVREKTAYQIRGKQNVVPVPKYVPYVVSFLNQRQLGFLSDGERMGLFHIEGRTVTGIDEIMQIIEGDDDLARSLFENKDSIRRLIQFMMKSSPNPSGQFAEILIPLMVRLYPSQVAFVTTQRVMLGTKPVDTVSVSMRSPLWYFCNPANGYGVLLPDATDCLRRAAREAVRQILSRVAERPLDIYEVDSKELNWLVSLAEASETYREFSHRSAQVKMHRWKKIVSDIRSKLRKNGGSIPTEVQNFVSVVIPRFERERTAGAVL